MQKYSPNQAQGLNRSSKTPKGSVSMNEAFSSKPSLMDHSLRYGDLQATPMIYSMGVPVQLPIMFTGDDGSSYVLDQFQDPQTGVYNLYVFKKNGPYSYEQVYKGDGFKAKNDDSYGNTSYLNVDHVVSPDNATKVISGDDLTSLSSQIRKMNLGFSLGDLLKQAPSILGHVIEIGTTIAGLASQEDEGLKALVKTQIKSPLVSVPIAGPVGYYSIGANTTSGNSTGLNVSTYSTSNVNTFMNSKNKDPQLLLPSTKYVIPVLKWSTK